MSKFTAEQIEFLERVITLGELNGGYKMTNNQAKFQRIVLLLEQRSATRLAQQKPRQMWICPCSELECDGGCATNAQVWKYGEMEAAV